jgi:TnpA family transposase
MPVDFLTDEQAQRYGHYAGEPTAAQLSRYFYLDDSDRSLIAARRGDHNRLGFALQLCTVRFLGTFLADPTDVPDGVVNHLAAQLKISDLDYLSSYRERPATHREHAGEIQRCHNYHDFTDQPEHLRLVRWLYTRAWLSAERPIVLFDLATARLVERKILLPGVSLLTRLIARVRDRAAARLWRSLAQLPTVKQQKRLDALLVAPAASMSPLDRLRRAPTRISAPAMTGALERLSEIRALEGNTFNLSRIPPGHVKALARYAAAARAQAIERMPDRRRTATLVAFAQVFEAVAQDDALDLLNQLIMLYLARAEEDGKNERLRTIQELDAAALRMRSVCKVVLDPKCLDHKVRFRIFAQIAKQQLEEDVDTVGILSRTGDDKNKYYDHLVNNYGTVRRFLPSLLRNIEFEGTTGGVPVLQALRFLKKIEGKPNPTMEDAPQELVNAAWKKPVLGRDGKIDRRFYTFCVLERLQDSLSRRDVYVTPSERWGDPRAKLLHGQAWETARLQVCRTLDLAPTAEPELAELGKQIDEAYRRVNANLPTNPALRIERVKGKDHVSLTGLDKLDEPDSLIKLKDQVQALLPRVDITDALLEMHAYTGFADEFTHISKSDARVDDLALSICAVLIAEASNTGLEPIARSDIPALTLGRLAWVQQNYVRAETLIRANARLVDAQARIPLAQAFGGGEVASADGLRFVVPVRTLNAGPNSKYFNAERGVTYYNFTSDQFSGFHGIVIPGTLRDSLYVLDGLLEQQTSLQPTQLITDTAGYSDIVFGLFWLLGYQFSPRLADLGDARFWRLDPAANYDALNGLARNRVKLDLISRNWDDFLRVAGSLKMGRVRASEVIRTLQGGGRRSLLGRAIGELGRIPKTLHLLNTIDDEAYRRRTLTQLNRGEGRHRLARKLFHGQRGELRQRYREGQEDQLGALGLVLNALILWNTRYMDAALVHLRAHGISVKPEDVPRLSPLGDKHFNVLGRYHFHVTDSILKGELRSLRTSSDLIDYEGVTA